LTKSDSVFPIHLLSSCSSFFVASSTFVVIVWQATKVRKNKVDIKSLIVY
jgi:hypothetical protein